MQSVLATDGNVSFAIFLYEDARFVNITNRNFVGFASGNGSSIALRELGEKNVYRIDGKIIE